MPAAKRAGRSEQAELLRAFRRLKPGRNQQAAAFITNLRRHCRKLPNDFLRQQIADIEKLIRETAPAPRTGAPDSQRAKAAQAARLKAARKAKPGKRGITISETPWTVALEHAEALEAHELAVAAAVWKATNTLRPDLRQVMQWRLRGLNLEAIAARLGSSISTVWRKLQSAQSQVLEAIDRPAVADPPDPHLSEQLNQAAEHAYRSTRRHGPDCDEARGFALGRGEETEESKFPDLGNSREALQGLTISNRPGNGWLSSRATDANPRDDLQPS
jgi:DNA-directed RNA polymerase specialized sigma24 family protein